MVMSFAYRNGLERSWKKHKPPHNPLTPLHVSWNNLATTALIGTSVGPCCPSFQCFGQDVAYEMRSATLCYVLLRSATLWQALAGSHGRDDASEICGTMDASDSPTAR